MTLSSERCFAGQELGIALEIDVKPGWHIYGKPLPSNYRPTELILSGPLVDTLTLELPAPQTKLMKALNETLPIYEGRVRALGKLGIKWSPPMPAPFLLKIGPVIEPGSHKIEGVLRYQACSETVCEPPEEVRFELPLTIEKGVPSVPKPG
ncbi:MAG TPA: protein-disulfide reductase DsbD domain-containing protein [Candidatus Binataceae bacterium]|nr:protein-disulfide reductase DsbD domain-containing protein [Candidatus Binataceae bacterium]